MVPSERSLSKMAEERKILEKGLSFLEISIILFEDKTSIRFLKISEPNKARFTFRYSKN